MLHARLSHAGQHSSANHLYGDKNGFAVCPAQGSLTAMLRKLYDKTLALSGHRNAVWGLAGLSFIESSVFPIPPDVMLIPMALADRARAFFHAAICTLASAFGALLGYVIGAFFWEVLGEPIIALYGGAAAFDQFTAFYDEWGVLIVLAAAISFLPFKVATIASGVAGLAIVPFFVASLVGRGIRFFAVAGLVYWAGPQVKLFIDRYFGWLSAAFVVLLAGGFILLARAG